MSRIPRRKNNKPNIPSEIRSISFSSMKTLKELEEYLKAFDELAKRAEMDMIENYCSKCKRSRDSPESATDLSMFRNQQDVQEIEKLEREIKRMKEENHEQELADLRKEVKKLRKEAQSTEDLKAEVEKLRKERDASEKEIKSLKDNVSQLENKKSQLLKQYTDWQRTETLLQRVHRENTELQRGKESLEMELRREKEATAHHQNEIRKLSNEIHHLRQRPRKRISLYTHTTLNPTLADHALRELMTKLRERLQIEKVELEDRTYDSRRDVTGPVVAICINVSRLGTDVQEVVKNVRTEHQDIVVLVLHHKETHALPNQSSDRILTGSEYKKLGAIIDVAFLSNKGMYQCDLNSLAIERLVSFLLQYKKDV